MRRVDIVIIVDIVNIIGIVDIFILDFVHSPGSIFDFSPVSEFVSQSSFSRPKAFSVLVFHDDQEFPVRIQIASDVAGDGGHDRFGLGHLRYAAARHSAIIYYQLKKMDFIKQIKEF